MSFSRPPAVAGMFYSQVPAVLTRDVDDLLSRAQKKKTPGTILGLIVPHAGYVYSGFTAAHAYRMLEGKHFDAVIVIGPSHREYFDGISVFPGDSYRTPLGEVPVHSVIRDELVALGKGVIVTNAGHRTEHSVEVQLPFLQRTLKRFDIVPLVMGDQRRELCENLAECLAVVSRNRNILFVASSDLSHYHPYDAAVGLDHLVIADVESFNPDHLMDTLEHEEVEACGGGPIVSIMLAARKLGCDKSEILHYSNSGDVTGEKEAVVGYMAAALMKVP
ncbi:MAG: AmmeMemoRadiSam system protein B [Bacteroidota bacterium]